MCEVVLGGDDATARFLVEPVDDAGALDSADAAQFVAMMQQRVHERAGEVADCGMHDEAGGFVDHDEVAVFVEHIECDVLGLRGAGRDFRLSEHDAFVAAQLVVLLCLRAVDGEVPALDE